ncbi:MAG: hypothetical protein WDO73_35240 [Ignavibacteriota bacterium]
MSRVQMYLSSLAASAILVLPAFGQAVISTRSGVVHFFEGAVSVAGRPLESHFGKFTTIPEGAELRTGQGRAEVLLTPGVILRVGENSAIRMASTALADTRVELVAGSAVVESAELTTGTSATLAYKNWSVHQEHQGSYRVDADPPRLQVRAGSVEVVANGEQVPVMVAQGMELPLTEVLAPTATAPEPPDSLNDWAEGRSQSISADNAIAADIQDPANISGTPLGTDAFTYFPMLGYPSLNSSLSSYPGLYGSTPGTLYQPGFNSLYLPGYTYRPLYLGLPFGGLNRSIYAPPSRFVTPVRPIGRPGVPIVHPITPPPCRPCAGTCRPPLAPALEF